MEQFKKLGLIGLVAFTMGLAGCSTDTGRVNNDGTVQPGDGDGDGAPCTTQDVLDGVQCTIDDVTDILEDLLGGTPLEGLIQCLDPTVNDLLDGPDSLVTTLLQAIATQDVDPEAFQGAAEDLAAALTTLGTNAPNLLLALTGDQDAIAACTGGGGSDGGDTTLDPTALCVIPVLGEAVVEAAGGSCTGEGGTGGSPLPVEQLCAVPVLGPILAEGAGASCDGGGGGSPLPAEQLAPLCAIPTLGPIIVEGAGGTCDGGGGGDSPLDPAALCAIPVLGEQIVSAIGSSCEGGGGDSPLPTDQLAALCAIPVLGPALVEGAGGTCDGGGGGDSPLDPSALCAIPVLGPILAGGAGADCPAASSTGGAFLPPLSLP